MPAFTATQRYSAWRDGRPVGGWQAGAVVEVDDELAAWVNRDSPGTLAPLSAAPEPATITPEPAPEAPEREAKPARNRQYRGGRNRTTG